MHEGLDIKFQYDSPDDRLSYQTYYLQPTTPLYTGTTTSVAVDFQAIFDRTDHSDPICAAHTVRI